VRLGSWMLVWLLVFALLLKSNVQCSPSNGSDDTKRQSISGSEPQTNSPTEVSAANATEQGLGSGNETRPKGQHRKQTHKPRPPDTAQPYERAFTGEMVVLVALTALLFGVCLLSVRSLASEQREGSELDNRCSLQPPFGNAKRSKRRDSNSGPLPVDIMPATDADSIIDADVASFVDAEGQMRAEADPYVERPSAWAASGELWICFGVASAASLLIFLLSDVEA
jgi:hypothetical protein